MPGTVAQAVDRLRILRAARASWEATITVERVDVPRGVKRFSGITLIDDRQVGWLVGGEKREFVVPPGQHKVTVLFARRVLELRSPGSPREATACASCSLLAGERVDFLCGTREDVIRHWTRVARAEGYRALLTSWVSIGLVSGAFWAGAFLIQFLRPAVALAIDEGFLNPVFYQFTSPLFSAIGLALLTWWILRRTRFLSRPTSFAEKCNGLGSPYFLELTESKPGAESVA